MKTISRNLSLCAAISVLLVSACSKRDSKSGGVGGGAGAALTPPAGPVELKVKWTVGRKYDFRMESTETMAGEMPGYLQPTKQIMHRSQDLTVSVLKELGNGGRQLELTFVAQKADMFQGDRKSMSFDSAQDPSRDSLNSAASMLRKMVGGRLQYLTDENGKVEKMEGFEPLLARAAGTNRQARGLFQQIFNQEELKRYAEFAEGMPGRPVKPGDTWPVQGEMGTPGGPVSWNLKNTFKEWAQRSDHTCVRMQFSGDLSLKSDPAGGPGGFKLENGKISGESWFDPELGMVVDLAGEESMTLKIQDQGKTFSPKMTRQHTLTLQRVTGP